MAATLTFCVTALCPAKKTSIRVKKNNFKLPKAVGYLLNKKDSAKIKKFLNDYRKSEQNKWF